MRWIEADPNTRSGKAIPDMDLQDNEIDPSDITNRALSKALGYPKDGTDSLLARGMAGSEYWLECPDDMWATVSPHLTTAETASVVTSKPSGFSIDFDRARHAPKAGRVNIVTITDSIGWNNYTETHGIDSYVTKAVEAAFGALSPVWRGEADRERANSTHMLLHHGNGGSRLGRTDGIEFGEEHNMQREIKYDTLPLQDGDMILIALGSNDVVAGAEGVDGAGLWARLQTFVSGLVAAHPTIHLIVATVIRRTEDSGTNTKINDFNTLLRAGYAAEGITALLDLEQAHADFSATSGDSAGDVYYDGVHLSAAGITVAAAALAPVIEAVSSLPPIVIVLVEYDGGQASTDYTGLSSFDGGQASTDYTSLDNFDGGSA